MDTFCAACAGRLAPFEEHGHMRQKCPRCGRIQYHNSKPAVTAIIPRGGKVLLSRRAREPHRGLWDLPGGFLESGEHPEAGILREIREETGLEARIVRLITVATGIYQEYDTLNLIYEVEVAGEPVAMDDSMELRFFAPDEIPAMAFAHERAALLAYTRGSLAGPT